MTDELFDRLSAPFAPEAISWRVGSTNINKQSNEPPAGKDAQGLALAYLDSRDVQDRFDQVCGPAGWQDDYPHAGIKTVCRIGVRVGDEWIWKSDGAGDTDVEAEKGALSDAFKRAAVKWGVGRYLYGLKSPWVKLEQRGRSWVIKQSEYQTLSGLLGRHAAPPRAAPQAVSPKAPVLSGKAINTPLEAFIASMKMNKTIAAVDAWAKREAIAIGRMNDADQAAMQTAYEGWRKVVEAAPEPKQAQATTSLAGRALLLESALNECADAAQLDRVWTRGRQVLDELDRSDPERRAELDALYGGLSVTLPAMEHA